MISFSWLRSITYTLSIAGTEQEKNIDLESILERKGRRESKMILQLKHLEMGEREREGAEVRAKDYQASRAEWENKETAFRQEIARLQYALAEESRLRLEEKEREKAKIQRLLHELETLETCHPDIVHGHLGCCNSTATPKTDIGIQPKHQISRTEETVVDLRIRLADVESQRIELQSRLTQTLSAHDELQARFDCLLRQSNSTTSNEQVALTARDDAKQHTSVTAARDTQGTNSQQGQTSAVR